MPSAPRHWQGLYDHYKKEGGEDDVDEQNTHELTRAEFDKEMNELRTMLKLPTVKPTEPSNGVKGELKPTEPSNGVKGELHEGAMQLPR